MHPFSYTRVSDTREALNAGRRGGRYIAGGTTLVDLMRETVERPETLVDITALPLSEITVTERGGLRIGALVTMSEAAAHAKVRTLYPVVSEALELSASAQLRNMATIGGNIMQRTRCTYFRDVTADCNKREPGSGCAALHGVNRTHAILGTSDACVATHPSDAAVAFAALEARVHLLGPDGARHIPFADFLLRPGSTPSANRPCVRGVDHSGGDPRPAAPAQVRLSEGAGPAVLRVRPDVGGRRAAHTRWGDPRGQGRRRGSGHGAVEAARRRAAPPR